MAKIVNSGLQLGGDVLTRGGVAQTAFIFDSDGNVLFARGASVPADAGVGFAVGCIFIGNNQTGLSEKSGKENRTYSRR